MLIYPAVDLYGGKAVRLIRGDYAQMTVYSDHPQEIAKDFAAQGASQMHIVDLEGAKTGGTPNLSTIIAIREAAGLFCEVGGGIRSMSVVDGYLGAGIDRVILGTAAVTDPLFLKAAVEKYGPQIAVGVDIKDGYVAVKGWTEKSSLEAFLFCRSLQDLGVQTIICTDISRDGMMAGTNVDLYKKLSSELALKIIASGGVSTLEDVKRLTALGLYGAIIGKAYYTGALRISDAVACARA